MAPTMTMSDVGLRMMLRRKSLPRAKGKRRRIITLTGSWVAVYYKTGRLAHYKFEEGKWK